MKPGVVIVGATVVVAFAVIDWTLRAVSRAVTGMCAPIRPHQPSQTPPPLPGYRR